MTAEESLILVLGHVKAINQKLTLIVGMLENKEPFSGMTPEQTVEAFGDKMNTRYLIKEVDDP